MIFGGSGFDNSCSFMLIDCTKKNMHVEKTRMVHFHPQKCDYCFALAKGGTNRQRIRYIVRWLEVWLAFQASIGVTGVIVFDIDDTLVDSKERRILPVCRLYIRAQKLGFKCAIVTARPEGALNRKETIDMLRANKIIGWESLYMMPKTYPVTEAGISAYKRNSRCDISTRFKIVANLGDMWTDIVKYPLGDTHKNIHSLEIGECGVMFPPHSDGEVALKLIGSYHEDDELEAEIG